LAKAKKRVARAAGAQTGPILSPVMVGLVIAAALLIVGGLILLGNQASAISGSVDTSQFPTLGNSNAPVTLTEFSDYG
jgi:protein-disulfide isomerase